MDLSWGDFDGLNDDERSGLGEEPVPTQVRGTGVLRTAVPTEYRYFRDERELRAASDWTWDPGRQYVAVTGPGDINMMSFIRRILGMMPVDSLTLSTWMIPDDAAEELLTECERGRIKRFDAYLDVRFIRTRTPAYMSLLAAATRTGGRIAGFYNHSKVTIAYGGDRAVTILSSANLNSDERVMEAHVITVNRTIADFYREWFDGILPANTGDQPEGWRPWEGSR